MKNVTMVARPQATRQMIRTTITITLHRVGLQPVDQVEQQVAWIQHVHHQECKANRVQQL